MKLPKRIPVELLRERLGDGEAEKLMLVLYGTELAPKLSLSAQEVADARKLLAGETVTGRVTYKKVLLAFCASRGPRKAAVLRFLDEQEGAAESSGGLRGREVPLGDIPKRLSEARGDMTQRQLAEAIGVDQSWVSAAFTGRIKAAMPEKIELVERFLQSRRVA